MAWSSSVGLESHDWQPRSAQIEMTSYVLLAFFRRGSLVEGIGLMKWLSEQRNHLGGFGTTQVRRVAASHLPPSNSLFPPFKFARDVLGLL